ncbi:MAG: hypothetical protein L0Y42_02215 [Phycisphaerales bacterium]|nr:hypothetical protein [Phycisphaerales bacterium]
MGNERNQLPRAVMEGYQPRKNTKGYQPEGQRGYQPQSNQPLDPMKLKPPSGGSGIQPPAQTGNSRPKK